MRHRSVIFSWKSGEVSVDWKLANVPVFKKGKKEDPGNYRPVSLTSVPGKIMEKIIMGVIETHTNDCSHWSQPTKVQKRKVLFNKLNFLL